MPGFIGGSTQNFQAEDSQEIWIIEQRSPMQVGVFEQRPRLNFANLASVAVHITSMVNDPIRALRLVVRPSDKQHGMERLALHGLVEK
jgi:hypothetical protein